MNFLLPHHTSYQSPTHLLVGHVAVLEFVVFAAAKCRVVTACDACRICVPVPVCANLRMHMHIDLGGMYIVLAILHGHVILNSQYKLAPGDEAARKFRLEGPNLGWLD